VKVKYLLIEKYRSDYQATSRWLSAVISLQKVTPIYTPNSLQFIFIYMVTICGRKSKDRAVFAASEKKASTFLTAWLFIVTGGQQKHIYDICDTNFPFEWYTSPRNLFRRHKVSKVGYAPTTGDSVLHFPLRKLNWTSAGFLNIPLSSHL